MINCSKVMLLVACGKSGVIQLTPIWGAENSYGTYGKVVRWTGLGLSVVEEISRLQF